MSGNYNYNPKVLNQNKIFLQMESGGTQAPFYFGGSQVPINHTEMMGSGFRTQYESSNDDIKKVRLKGCGMCAGIQTTSKKTDNIRIPKVLFHK
jgi:hypothetical protein